ncbi:hypothetical protein HAX54_037803 [Datura stramonium]|uniref:Uncharacterized protein n=1 Tax=Datura stramonium TaxID=4076 RepID=A0ABS8VM31_DATST|nr:hypothetical protein [Datura stramonium]
MSMIWSEMLECLQAYRPRIYSRVMYWEFPPSRWVKCSTDVHVEATPGSLGKKNKECFRQKASRSDLQVSISYPVKIDLEDDRDGRFPHPSFGGVLTKDM